MRGKVLRLGRFVISNRDSVFYRKLFRNSKMSSVHCGLACVVSFFKHWREP